MTKLTKTDELLLLGENISAIKLMLRSIRSARTQARNTLRSVDVSERRWPNEGATFRASMREQCELAIEHCDRTEEQLKDWLKQEMEQA